MLDAILGIAADLSRGLRCPLPRVREGLAGVAAPRPAPPSRGRGRRRGSASGDRASAGAWPDRSRRSGDRMVRQRQELEAAVTVEVTGEREVRVVEPRLKNRAVEDSPTIDQARRASSPSRDTRSERPSPLRSTGSGASRLERRAPSGARKPAPVLSRTVPVETMYSRPSPSTSASRVGFTCAEPRHELRELDRGRRTEPPTIEGDENAVPTGKRSQQPAGHRARRRRSPRRPEPCVAVRRMDCCFRCRRCRSDAGVDGRAEVRPDSADSAIGR